MGAFCTAPKHGWAHETGGVSVTHRVKETYFLFVFVTPHMA